MKLYLLIVLADVAFNYWLIEVKKQKPNYPIMNTIRAMVAIFFGSWYFYWAGTFEGVNDMSVYSPLELLWIWWPLLSFQISSHFTLFSPLLNFSRPSIRRKHNWFTYRGKQSGWLDGIAMGDYPWIYWTIYGASALYFLWMLVH